MILRLPAPVRRVADRVLHVLIVLVLGASAAFAHASLLTTTPPDGAVVETAPETLTLVFNEPVRPLIARLTAADGTTRMLDPPRIEGLSVIYPLPPDPGRGSHLLSWRVTSEDGHPLAGGTLFSVGAPTGDLTAATLAPFDTRVFVWAARAGLVLAVLLAVGGAVFGDARARRAAVAGLVLTPLALVGQGLDLMGLPLSAIIDAAPWREGAQGAPGLALAFTAAAFGAVCVPGRAAVVAALVLAGFGAATSGHAATAPPRAFMRPAVAIHVIAAALWIGALAPLAAGLTRPGVLARFGRIIPWVVAALIASGGAIAVVQVERLPALWQTGYGRVLLAKLALVSILLLVALVNRLRLTPRAEAGDPAPLRRAIAVEIGLAVLIVAVLALWRFTPPPRSLLPDLSELAQPFDNGALKAVLHAAPPREGPVTFRLSGITLDGVPVEPQQVDIELAKPAYGIGPFRREVPGTGGEIALGTFVLPLDGYWVVTLKVRIGDFRSEQIRDIVEIAPAR